MSKPEQPRSEDFDFVGKEREKESDETVNSHLREHTGQHYGDAGGRGFIGVGQPGVKRKERHFHREPEKDSGEGEPRELTGEQPGLSEIGERDEVERALREINSEEGEQHGHTAEECVNEKLGRGAVAFFAAPDFNEQERRDEAHLIKQKPEDEILCGERSVERRLHDQHQGAETAADALRKKCERKNERRQQYEQQS